MGYTLLFEQEGVCVKVGFRIRFEFSLLHHGLTKCEKVPLKSSPADPDPAILRMIRIVLQETRGMMVVHAIVTFAHEGTHLHIN